VTEHRSPHEPATSYTARITNRPALRKLMALAAEHGHARNDEPRADDNARSHTDPPRSQRRSGRE